MTITNFAEFGWRERKLAAELLTASCEQGWPKDFSDDEVQIMMNKNSGSVFFTNSEYQVCMMNGDELEMWHNLPYYGQEGFADDLKGMYEYGDIEHEDDIEYLVSVGIIEAPDEEEEEEEQN